jgi:hypothetical protein
MFLCKFKGPHLSLRIPKNVEIDKLIEGADIVRFIKAQRIKWPGLIQKWTKQEQLGSY